MENNSQLTNKDKRDIAIQMGLNAIPYFGGSLNTLFFGAKQERRFKRIENLYDSIRADFENIQKNVKPITDQDKNKIASLLEEIHEGVERDFTEEKITYFKNCFFNILTEPNDDDYRKRKYFISILGSLSELDIEIIAELYKAGKEQGIQPDFDSEVPNMHEFNASLEKLRSFGLVNSSLNGTLRPGINWSQITLYSISEFGIDFSKFCLENDYSKMK